MCVSEKNRTYTLKLYKDYTVQVMLILYRPGNVDFIPSRLCWFYTVQVMLIYTVQVTLILYRQGNVD